MDIFQAATHLSLPSNQEESSTFFESYPKDSDGDGVSNLFDNCLATANPDQADVNGNGMATPGEVTPTVCILHKGDRSDLRAVFGYSNPNIQIGIAYGPNNALAGAIEGTTGTQPTVFDPGAHSDVFEVVFDHKRSVSWTVDGHKVVANQHTQHCGHPADDHDDHDHDDDWITAMIAAATKKTTHGDTATPRAPLDWRRDRPALPPDPFR